MRPMRPDRRHHCFAERRHCPDDRDVPHVECRDASGTMEFPTRQAVREFVAATSNRAHLAGGVERLPEPFTTRIAFVVYVAETAR